jgi:dihydrodipicolinate synthase/N-acetylneuraminate lyase
MKRAPAAAHPFSGIIIASITPRREHETSIDLGAALELMDRLSETGAAAIALLGSTGEFVHFALDDRRHMTDFTVKRSRLPLLVNVTHSTLDGAVELARDAAASGAAGLLLAPPYYFRYGQPAIRNFYLDFLAQTGTLLPAFLYNIPQFTNEVALPTALELLSSGGFAGIKDSSGSWEYFSALQQQALHTPFTILSGSERIYVKARLAGAHGIVSGVACAIPELLVALEHAIAAEDSPRIGALDQRLQEFVNRIDCFPAPIGIQEAVRHRKWRAGVPAIAPGMDCSDFSRWFTAWLPAVLDECKIKKRR